MNWGKVFGWTSVIIFTAASIGYFLARDIKRGFYYLFAAGIQVTVIN